MAFTIGSLLFLSLGSLLLSVLCPVSSQLADQYLENNHGHSHGEYSPSYKYSRQANTHGNREKDDVVHHSDLHQYDHMPSDFYSNSRHRHIHPKDERSFVASDISLNWTTCIKALLSTLLISVSPVFILCLVPISNANEQQHLLKILLSFASGGLLGDAFLHLIPHAMSLNLHERQNNGHFRAHCDVSQSDNDEHHIHDMSVGLWVLTGIMAFMVVEKIVRSMREENSEPHGHQHHCFSQLVPDEHMPATEQRNIPEVNADTVDEIENNKNDKESMKSLDNNPDVSNESTLSKHDSVDHKELKEADNNSDNGFEHQSQSILQSNSSKDCNKESCCAKNSPNINVAGYLNLAADFAHNFTDGLAIGASFLRGNAMGLVTTFTIFLHEIPHEIGDFAILVQSGYTKKQAMLLQLTTAIGALLGTLLSLVAGGIGTLAMAWVLPFTAGGFIYIATVSVLPELLRETKFTQSVLEIAALILGVYMMALIAQYE